MGMRAHGCVHFVCTSTCVCACDALPTALWASYIRLQLSLWLTAARLGCLCLSST